MLRQNGQTSDPPIPVIHVLPSKTAGPLPSLVENFVLKFSSNISTSTAGKLREVWMSVVTSSVWRTSHLDSLTGSVSDLTGVKSLLFNGVRNMPPDGHQRRALLSNWQSCLEMPGALSASTPTSDSNTRPPISAQSKSYDRPLYNSQTLPSPRQATSPQSPSYRESPMTPLASAPLTSSTSDGYTSSQIDATLLTPELASTSLSSRSSTSESAQEAQDPASSVGSASASVSRAEPTIVGADDDTTPRSTTPLDGLGMGKKMGSLGKTWRRVTSIRSRRNE